MLDFLFNFAIIEKLDKVGCNTPTGGIFIIEKRIGVIAMRFREGEGKGRFLEVFETDLYTYFMVAKMCERPGNKQALPELGLAQGRIRRVDMVAC